MRARLPVPSLLAMALLSAGCARLGLNPLPESVETGSVDHGLDPFPEPMHPGGTQNVGLDPFPPAMHKGEDFHLGLQPFPKKPAVAKPDEDGKFGLDPFPAPMHKGEKFALGLHPFPKAEKKGASAVASKDGSSRTVSTEVPESEEYPTPPPVVLPAPADRSAQADDLARKKKRPAWKDD